MVAGLLVIPAALVFFMVSKEWSLVKSLIWLSVAIIILTLFFLGYNVVDDKPSIFHFLTDPWFASKYALVLVSSPFATGLGYVLPMVISCLALGLIVIVAVKLGLVNYLRRPEGLAILYILILLAAVTAGRSGFEELSTATSSRYLVYTKVFWLLIIISILSLFTLKRTTQQLILGGVFMYSIINTSVATTHLGAQARQQSNALIDYWFRGNAGGLKYTSRAKDAGVRLRAAEQVGVYLPSPKMTKPSKHNADAQSATNDDYHGQVIRYGNKQQVFYLAAAYTGGETTATLVLDPINNDLIPRLSVDMSLLDRRRLNLTEYALISPEENLVEVILDRSILEPRASYRVILNTPGAALLLGQLNELGIFNAVKNKETKQ